MFIADTVDHFGTRTRTKLLDQAFELCKFGEFKASHGGTKKLMLQDRYAFLDEKSATITQMPLF
jgi:hypothetical protein